MTIKEKISPRGMVLRTLSMAGGDYLSVSQIISKVYEEYGINLQPRTVVAAIDESDYCTGIIEERIERRGKQNVPVKVFSITQK